MSDADAPDPEPSVTEEFFNASVDDLRNEPAPTPGGRSIEERLDEAKLDELNDARGYRGRVVIFTLVVVGGLVLASTVFMGLYFWSQWGGLDSSVIIAFFASVVVESIGILYVISQYLFPNGK